MKGIIIGLGVLLGLTLGFFPSLQKNKPIWWKLLVAISILVTIILTFAPYVGSNFATFKFVAKNIPNFTGPLYFRVKEISNDFTTVGSNYKIIIANPQNPLIIDSLLVSANPLQKEFQQNEKVIAEVTYDLENQIFKYNRTIVSNPLWVLPFVPQLGEQIRIMNIHVPFAWVAVVAYFISMFYSIRFLKSKKHEYDLIASSSASLGTIYAILATITGMIWAKFNWGSFWNWDPRQTSIFVLLLIYLAYFVLRQSLENFEIKARLSSVYSIIAFVTVPFLVFIMPRLLEGNHPGSANSPNLGPILSAKEDSISLIQTLGFSFGFFSFSLLFFWLLNLKIRISMIYQFISRQGYDRFFNK